MATAGKRMKVNSFLLICTECKESYKSPKRLPCYHSFCEKCIAKLQRGSEVVCPNCKETSTVPEGGVKRFPDNIVLNRLIDEVESSDKAAKKCDWCIRKDEPTVAFCSECSKAFCKSCKNMVRSFRTTMLSSWSFQSQAGHSCAWIMIRS